MKQYNQTPTIPVAAEEPGVNQAPEEGFKPTPVDPRLFEEAHKKEAEKPQGVFTHEQLLNALFAAWDLFDTSSITMFLIGDTAEQASNTKELSGDKLTLGIRQAEWRSGSHDIAQTFMPAQTEDYNKLTYTMEGVPVEVYLFEDSPSVTSLNTLFYANEFFNFPNTLEDFEKTYKWRQ